MGGLLPPHAHRRLLLRGAATKELSARSTEEPSLCQEHSLRLNENQDRKPGCTHPSKVVTRARSQPVRQSKGLESRYSVPGAWLLQG